MKIEYGPEQKNEEKTKYPYFGKFIGYGDGPFVVLFTKPKTGMVVKSENHKQPLYTYSVSWIETDSQFIKLENFSVKFSTD